MAENDFSNKKITIKDVAKEAGVSISTVSNALNGSDLVNEDTRSRILAIAERVNYIPNLNGRYLKSGRTKTLGFVTSSVRGQYFSMLADAMYRECDRLGYALNILVTRDKSVIMSNILGKSFDGVFIFEGERIGNPELEMIEKNNIKTVLLDRNYVSRHIGCVIFDSYKVGYEAARYLINLGHKKIYFIEAAGDVFDSMERKRGYIDAMRDYDVEFREEYVVFGMFEELFTYNAIISLLRLGERELPDAFIGGNDLSAIGCMKALQSLGYHVPDDVSVIGFDDIEIGEYLRPSLTTIKNPIDTQGTTAVRLMTKMLNENSEGKVEVLNGKLMQRNSSGICRRLDKRNL